MFELILNDRILQILILLITAGAAIITFFMVRGFNAESIRMQLGSGLNNLSSYYSEKRVSNEIKKYTRTVIFKLSFLERLEIRYVDKPNIRKVVFFANIYVVLGVAAFILLSVTMLVYMYLYHLPSSLCIGILSSAIVFVGLDMVTKYNTEKIRKQMAIWIATLNRWVDIKEDVSYILDKSVLGTPEPLKSHIKECVIQMNTGINKYEALDILSSKIDSEQFKDFVLNLKQTLKHRGNLKALLNNLEEEFYMLEEEYARRKITTFSSRLRTYVLMAFVLIVGFAFLNMNLEVRAFYMETDTGKLLLTLFFGMYFLAFLISTKVTNFNY